MEEQNTEEQNKVLVTEEIPEQVATITTNKVHKKKYVILSALALVLITAGCVWFLTQRKDDSLSTQNNNSEITTFEQCVSAGNPTLESNPEQCIANGKTFTNEAAKDTAVVEEEVVSDVSEEGLPSCTDEETRFSDEDFGAAFCYPSEWGEASVVDAKVDPSDTGHREAVRFMDNTKFVVGGTSEDWSTTVGRGVGCQEPNNSIPELSTYDTAWHDLIGSGMDVEFASRSLASSEGGYDMTETVSNLMDNGVCVQGHKVIDGSRYRVLFSAFYSDFTDGVLSPKAHIDNPSILFNFVERDQFDSLLASAVAY